MKDGNITVSVHMARAGALTRLSGWKTGIVLQCPAWTRKSFFSTASRLALGCTQPPIHWVLGDPVLAVCGQGMKLMACYLQHLHYFKAHTQRHLYLLPIPITVNVLMQQWEAHTLSPMLALIMMIMPSYKCK